MDPRVGKWKGAVLCGLPTLVIAVTTFRAPARFFAPCCARLCSMLILISGLRYIYINLPGKATNKLLTLTLL